MACSATDGIPTPQAPSASLIYTHSVFWTWLDLSSHGLTVAMAACTDQASQHAIMKGQGARFCAPRKGYPCAVQMLASYRASIWTWLVMLRSGASYLKSVYTVLTISIDTDGHVAGQTLPPAEGGEGGQP